MLGDGVPTVLLGNRRDVVELVGSSLSRAALEDQREKAYANVQLRRSAGHCLSSMRTVTRLMLPIISRAACCVDDALDGEASDHPDMARLVVIHS